MLVIVLLCCWIPPSKASVPFLSRKMAVAFKNSCIRLSYGDSDYDVSQKLILKLSRGGGQGTSSLSADAITTSTVLSRSNETTNTTSDVLTGKEYSDTASSVPYNFSLFQKGDGSETDPDGIPGRFLRMQKGNRAKAKAALEQTLAWRKEHQVDIILSKPHPKYDVCKRILSHYFSGRDPTGHVIFVQRPGKIKAEEAKLNNVTNDDLFSHYIYILEYCWNQIEPRSDQTMTSVIDLGGCHLTHVRAMFHFIKEFVNMMSQHYPQRSYKTLLINSPRWFGAIYRMISPMLRESTRSKIEILSGGKRQREALIQYLGNHAPKELLDGGDDHVEIKEEEDHAGPHSSMEKMMRAFVMERLDETGQVMQPIIH